MGLGKQIKKYREAAGWTLAELSHKSDVDIGTINALEVRNSSRSVYAPTIAKAFGLTLEQLLDEEATYTIDTTGSVIGTGATAVYSPTSPTPPARASAPVHLPRRASKWPFTKFTEDEWLKLDERMREGFEMHIEQSIIQFVRTDNDDKETAVG